MLVVLPVAASPDTITINTHAGPLSVQGVSIPVGGTRTIDLDLFSDADPGAAWTVHADDSAPLVVGNGALSISGIVTDARGLPLPGARVQLQGSAQAGQFLVPAGALLDVQEQVDGTFEQTDEFRARPGADYQQRPGITRDVPHVKAVNSNLDASQGFR